MPNYRIAYNAEALFIGPSPSSGFHFLSRSGFQVQEPNNNINLVSHLNRVQNVRFDIQSPSTDIQAFGLAGNLELYKTEHPTVSLEFDYLPMGVRNEDKLGLYVNFPYPNGTPIFPNNYQVFLLSGLYTSSMERSDRAYGWPLNYRDSKNLFLTISKSFTDFNNTGSGSSPTNCYTFAFGDCYLNNYSVSLAVGEIPKASCKYEATNLIYYTSGSGFQNPTINPTTYALYNNYCVIPNNYENSYVKALMPGDVSIDIVSYPIQTELNVLQGTGYANLSNPSLFNLGVAYTGIQLQTCSFNIDMPRRAVKNMLYKVPINKRLIFPVKANLNLTAIVHDYVSGSIQNLFNNQEEYDIFIAIRNPYHATTGGIAVRYDFKKLKIENYAFDTSIGENKRFSASFSVDLSPSDLSKGLFISGLYNTTEIQQNTSCLLQEDGSRIFQEDGSSCIIVANEIFFD